MSEHSPLLPPHNGDDGGQDYATLPPRSAPVTRKRGSRATTPATILITFTSLLLPLLLFFALFINSFIPSDEEIAQFNNSGLLYDHALTPQVGILNFTSGYTQAWIEVGGRVGIDVDAILGINGAGTGKYGRGQGARWWEALRTWAGRKGIDMVGPLVVVIPEPILVFLGEMSSTSSSPHHRHNVDVGGKSLFTVSLPTPIDLPLIVPSSNTPLPEHTYHLQLSINYPAHLLGFAHTAWRSGAAHFIVHVPRVIVVPAHTHGLLFWWRRWIRIEQKNLMIPQRVDGEFFFPFLSYLHRSSTANQRRTVNESFGRSRGSSHLLRMAGNEASHKSLVVTLVLLPELYYRRSSNTYRQTV